MKIRLFYHSIQRDLRLSGAGTLVTRAGELMNIVEEIKSGQEMVLTGETGVQQ